ncbi:YbaK/EbsC family protein [Jannaschia sp. S6380]|uniref:YbaK/EbsC family protein n=1 Tax=Jannaschia sp. S6380 TaxID=2926408 RepID=UPI001FF68A01|nr:YbaK/EbsC family protein [Jannaschia sp. S6380]MCK0166375.1 YbaK/EbsC family protein [Jannaschia sp. S6380]
MSKSLRRVEAALRAARQTAEPVELGQTRTARQAAEAVGCVTDQIVKSIVFGLHEGCALFLTAGGNRVDPEKAANHAGATLRPADAEMVRRLTGFAIGGVAPIGHLTPGPVWMDPRLLTFDIVWAAAGTPRHVFPIAPDALQRITGAIVAEFT